MLDEYRLCSWNLQWGDLRLEVIVAERFDNASQAEKTKANFLTFSQIFPTDEDVIALTEVFRLPFDSYLSHVLALRTCVLMNEEVQIVQKR